MPRKSPIHYIDPSAISIIPNANGQANDIAVYISRDTKIKVYCPKVGLNTDSSANYQEWTLSGRNRRLADFTKPYTIYARLPQSAANKDKGYLVFAAKIPLGGDWVDKYPYITTDGLADIEGAHVSDGNWYIRLGDVSLPENGQRRIDLDTGILGTTEFNTEWALNPDVLPLRIELGCTINDEDAGPIPYIFWNQSLILTASLVEGWTGTDIERFDHWKIMRDTGISDADATWNAVDRTDGFNKTGQIALSHTRGSGDDFNGAVSATFFITAYERVESEDSPANPEYRELISISINIMAETIEKYEMVFSAAIVSYNPHAQSYSPSSGVAIRFRATNQRGDVFMLTNAQFSNMGLSAAYRLVDSSGAWTPLTVSGSVDEAATATVPITAFHSQKSVNVRLTNSDGKELNTNTIAFVRDGEDSKEREWIFLRSETAITFGTQEYPYPANISGGQVNPTGAATGLDTDKNQDGWVPEGWWDEMQGTDGTNRYEYGAYRDYDHSNNQWGAFTEPKIWGHYGQDGQSGGNTATVMLYKRLAEPQQTWEMPINDVYYQFSNGKLYSTETGNIEANASQLQGWSLEIPGDSTDPIYVTSAIAYSNTARDVIRISEWVTPVQFTENGEDGADVIVATITPNAALYPTNNNGVLTSEGSSAHTIKFVVGSAEQSATLKNINCVIDGTTLDSSYHDEGSSRRVWRVVTNLIAGTFTLYGKNGATATETLEVTAVKTINGADVSRTLIVPIKPLKQGSQGNNGDDSINVIVSPASLIVNQSLQNPSNLDNLSEQILFSVLEGYTQKSVSKVEVTSVEQDTSVSPERNKCTVTGSNSYYATLTAVNKDSDNQYYDQAYLICKVYYDNNEKFVENVKVKVYANLLGTWKENVVGDVNTAVANSINYLYDPNNPNQVVKQSNYAEYVRSSTQSISTISQKVNNGKNLLSGVLNGHGWRDVMRGLNETDASVNANGGIYYSEYEFLQSPQISSVTDETYTLSFYTKAPIPSAQRNVTIIDIDGNTQDVNLTQTYDSDRGVYIQKCTFTAPDTSMSIAFEFATALLPIYEPQVELGSTATPFEALSSEISSQIKQTASEIIAEVEDTGVDITNGKINLYADKIKFYKNKAQAQSTDEAKVWIDGNNGTLHAVDGEFEGTIRANNLYHCVCLASTNSGYDAYSVALFYCDTLVVNGEDRRPDFYEANDTNWHNATWYINRVFEPGKYYTGQQIHDLTNGDMGQGSQGLFLGFTDCTGYSDIIYVVPGLTASAHNQMPDVVLPAPESVPGKLVDIHSFKYGNESGVTFTVRNAGNPWGQMTSLVYLDDEFNWTAVEPTGSITLVAEKTYRFISIPVNGVYYWLYYEI